MPGNRTGYRVSNRTTSLKSWEFLSKHNFDDGKNRYEMSAANVRIHHHHHLICLKCGQVIEVEEDLLDVLENKIQEKQSVL